VEASADAVELPKKNGQTNMMNKGTSSVATQILGGTRGSGKMQEFNFARINEKWKLWVLAGFQEIHKNRERLTESK